MRPPAYCRVVQQCMQCRPSHVGVCPSVRAGAGDDVGAAVAVLFKAPNISHVSVAVSDVVAADNTGAVAVHLVPPESDDGTLRALRDSSVTVQAVLVLSDPVGALVV